MSAAARDDATPDVVSSRALPTDGDAREFLSVQLDCLRAGFDTDPTSALAAQRLSPAVLAYLGDAVYEVCARSRYLLPPKRLSDYHRLVVSAVRAETQAERLQTLEPYLNADERDILRRGRNAASGRPRRLSPLIYQQATSLETLIGYLFLCDRERLLQVLQWLDLCA
ncbi:Ribonuclease III [Rubidibacter lacunae KORDI 51-2]|uniref:Mini-ribonuclease 3 n=1 Tax=Rubidibacter lacunae KORDI 51-2 TaxID=582515 RepID=U5DK92_9CHRO|nr:ribonuclease III domain-containing protein [Rubidibacter lacunae]ERN40100.1 Ribonuclease III [Rubidibacter lacunae KORDI 51-2]